MIFSGGVRFYKCGACASRYSNVTPTSVLPIGVVVAIATALWSRALSRIVTFRWLCLAGGLALAISSLWLIYKLVEALTTSKLRRGVCPKCGATLLRGGQGFYDGLVPNPWELLIYGLTLVLGILAVMVTRPGK